TEVQTCALPISSRYRNSARLWCPQHQRKVRANVCKTLLQYEDIHNPSNARAISLLDRKKKFADRLALFLSIQYNPPFSFWWLALRNFVCLWWARCCKAGQSVRRRAAGYNLNSIFGKQPNFASNLQ